MDLRKLKTLIDLVSESGISELEITEGEGKVRIVKNAPPVYVQPSLTPYSMPVSTSEPAAMLLKTSDRETSAPIVPPGHVVTSPMVGTFYRSPSPGANPFVQVGDAVKQGQILCIIEAMKLLNEVESDINGIIKEILTENGQAVEYGQLLFVIA